MYFFEHFLSYIIFFCQKWHFKVLFVVEYIFYTQSIFKFTFLNPKKSIPYIKLEKTCKKKDFYQK